MPTIEITQEALEALESSKFETASDAILAAMPKKAIMCMFWVSLLIKPTKRFFS